MADPTIQMSCCHLPNDSHIFTELLKDSKSNTYNRICLISSLLGVIGALYMILPRSRLNLYHRYTFPSSYGCRIAVWLAVADFLASLGVFTRSVLWLNWEIFAECWNESTYISVCTNISVWIQYFYTASWFWSLCYTIDIKRAFAEKQSCPCLYHIFAWILPAFITGIGTTILHFPDNRCYNSDILEHIVSSYCATYVPIIIIIMTVNPILYITTTTDVQRVVSRVLNQYTTKERQIVDSIKIKFCLIVATFYFCWLPNLVNGILLWSSWYNLPKDFMLGIWYVMAVTNPMQAFCNSVVYHHWAYSRDKLYIPCQQTIHIAANTPESTRALSETCLCRYFREEDIPLLQNTILVGYG